MTALCKQDDTLAWVHRSFGFVFVRPELCYAALTHRSAGALHNERLEFLGDSVLNCAVAQILYETHPQADEGDLSRLRASLVSGDALAQMAAELELGEHLRLGSGELKTGGFRRASILADALEAMFGAMFVDAGFEAVREVIGRLIGPRLAQLPGADTLKDSKTRLQELLQARGLPLPVYALTTAEGEAHEQYFTVSCEIAILKLRTSGEGANRRRAEQMAAQRAFDLIPTGRPGVKS